MATPSMFAYGGASRTVSIFELSKMAARAHWNSALKYDILYANFSSTSDSLMYLSGFDAEVRCTPRVRLTPLLTIAVRKK
jgi:hypothetical protein